MVQTPNLRGKTVAITRAFNQAQETAKIIEELGGKAYIIPTIEFKMPDDLTPVRTFIEDIQAKKASYVIFMSSNAIEFLFKEAAILNLSKKLEDGLNRATIIAIGPKTEEALKKYGVRVNFLPREYSSEGIVETIQKMGLSHETIYIPRVKNAGSTLREKLEALKLKVQEIPVYEQILPKDTDLAEKFANDLASGRIHAIIFGSAQSVRNLKKILENFLPTSGIKLFMEKVTIVAIGPETAKAIKEVDLRVDVIPKSYTFNAAIEALIDYWKQKR